MTTGPCGVAGRPESPNKQITYCVEYHRRPSSARPGDRAPPCSLSLTTSSRASTNTVRRPTRDGPEDLSAKVRSTPMMAPIQRPCQLCMSPANHFCSALAPRPPSLGHGIHPRGCWPSGSCFPLVIYGVLHAVVRYALSGIITQIRVNSFGFQATIRCRECWIIVQDTFMSIL